MKENSTNLQPRREFLKLAAFTGAAALAGGNAPAAAEPSSRPQATETNASDSKMEFLRVSGRQIVDGKGNKVRLRGTCPGGWMNMEDFINGHPGAEHTLRAQMAEVLGASRAQFFFDRLLDHFFNEDDVIFLRKAGANVARIPLNYRHFEDDAAPFKYKESGFARLDQVLRQCENHGLYVILDLHSAQGWQNVHWHSDNASRISLLWEVPAYQDRYVALWKEFASRYKNRAVVAGYDVLNEPCSNNEIGDYPWNIYSNYKPNWQRINAVFRRVVTEIRKVDTKHIIFLEGDNYAKQFSGFEKPFDDNLAYSSHNYTVPGFGPGQYPGTIHPRSAGANGAEDWDRAKQERTFLDAEGTKFTEQHNVPLWVGEFGSVFNGPPEENDDRLRALDDQIGIFENHGAHWTTWNYKDIGVMGMLTLDPASPYMDRISDLLKKKWALGTDDWMSWLPPTPVKDATGQLADQILGVVGDPQLDARLNRRCLTQTVLCFYTGTLMQPLYASLFKGMSENELDHVLSSFSAKQCVPNKGLVDVLSKYMAKPA
ncbi:MAG TPA: glycoside hydrolase family 5 protein [Acidobacteriaceae bacterium]|nr:glycoside hydrolase family 5 protein [Acidobacteriaceae bacterium]